MKSTATAAVFAAVLCATPLAAGESTDCIGFAYDLDIPGNDIGSQSAPGYFVCANSCIANPNCKAWTWSSNTCWLKGGQGSAMFYKGAVSGVKVHCFAPHNTKYLVVNNCDVAGNDAGSYTGTSYLDCLWGGAAAFTWSDWNGGTCWLKSGASQCQYAPNKFTGVLVW